MDFTKTLIEHKSPLKAFAINLTRDRDDALDLVQETYYRAYNNRDKFNEGTNIKAWLMTIMKNVFINNYRKTSKRSNVIDISENQYLMDTFGGIDFNRAERDFTMRDLSEAVSKLNAEYSIPFKMHVEGFKYDEIAEELKMPLGTVKSRIFFARKQIKGYLEKIGFNRF